MFKDTNQILEQMEKENGNKLYYYLFQVVTFIEMLIKKNQTFPLK